MSEHLQPNEKQVHSHLPADDEIDLRELWRIFLKYKRMIIKSVLGAAVLTAGLSMFLHNIYRAEILLASVKPASPKGGLASAFGKMSGLGDLASIAGVSLGGGDADENLAVMQSNNFLWKFVQEKNLMPILFENEWDEQKKTWKESDPKDQPGQMDVYRLFNDGGMLKVDKDKKTDLITVSIDWEDAALATEWVNALVDKLNQYIAQQEIARSESNLKYLNEELMRTQIEDTRQILFDMIVAEKKKIMLANTQKEYAFKVLDKAVEPDKKIKPKRSILVILSAFMAGFLALIYAYYKESIAKRRDDAAAVD
ncbi:MAG: Wzz/FepE/Etk N-terminal domain-containing protein [Sideroxydans sp.]|nr:Wzz/FepE/Etk N-terminal domain-containing protein [Sideroxydans sp.]